MKIIEQKGLNIDLRKKFKELKENEHFIYKVCDCECFAIKVSDEYAVFVNADNKFICAKAYKNCLSIGAGIVHEYSTYAEAVEGCKKNIVELADRSFYAKRNPPKRDHIR